MHALSVVPPPVEQPNEVRPSRLTLVTQIVMMHRKSGASRQLQLLKVSPDRAWIWWPLCGVYGVMLRGASAGRLLNYDESSVLEWQLSDNDLRRLRRGRPLRLFTDSQNLRDPGI